MTSGGLSDCDRSLIEGIDESTSLLQHLHHEDLRRIRGKIGVCKALMSAGLGNTGGILLKQLIKGTKQMVVRKLQT